VFGQCSGRFVLWLGIGRGRGRLFYVVLSSDFVHYPTGRSRSGGLVTGRWSFVLGVALQLCRVLCTSLLFRSLITRPNSMGGGDRYSLEVAHLGHLADFVAGYRPILYGGEARSEILRRALAVGSTMGLWVGCRDRWLRASYVGRLVVAVLVPFHGFLCVALMVVVVEGGMGGTGVREENGVGIGNNLVVVFLSTIFAYRFLGVLLV